MVSEKNRFWVERSTERIRMDYKECEWILRPDTESVELMKEHVKKTFRRKLMTNLGGFSGAFRWINIKAMESRCSFRNRRSQDEAKAAFLDGHDTVGIDCVICALIIACAGGKPVVFLDYIACGKIIRKRIADIVKGVSDGCLQAGCSLIGGETAEMPGFYPEDGI